MSFWKSKKSDSPSKLAEKIPDLKKSSRVAVVQASAAEVQPGSNGMATVAPASTPAPQSALASAASPPSATSFAPVAPEPGSAEAFARSFLHIVSALTRSPQYRAMPLSDLEWLVLPPLKLGQCAVLEGTAPTPAVAAPTAIALWAHASPELDRRLSSDAAGPVRMAPSDWRSGDILWLIDVVGDASAVAQLVAHLRSVTFKGRSIKFRAAGADGRSTVSVLNPI